MATYVLIHGAGSDAWYWHLVAPRLEGAGHEVVAPDLPSDDDAAGLDEYADAVVDAIGDARRPRRSSPSRSAGSPRRWCATACRSSCWCSWRRWCRRRASRRATGGRTPGTATARRERARARGPVDLDDADGRCSSTTCRADVWRRRSRTAREQSGTPFEKPWPLAAWPDVPTRFLLCRDDRFFPAEFLRRVVHERLGITPDEMDGGHLPALAHPEELVEQLEGFQPSTASERATHRDGSSRRVMGAAAPRREECRGGGCRACARAGIVRLFTRRSPCPSARPSRTRGCRDRRRHCAVARGRTAAPARGLGLRALGRPPRRPPRSRRRATVVALLVAGFATSARSESPHERADHVLPRPDSAADHAVDEPRLHVVVADDLHHGGRGHNHEHVHDEHHGRRRTPRRRRAPSSPRRRPRHRRRPRRHLRLRRRTSVGALPVTIGVGTRLSTSTFSWRVQRKEH